MGRPGRDGDEAVQNIEAGAFTHVILDLKIPKKSGLEVLQVIRPRSRDLRVVVLTSSRQPSDLDRAPSLGADRSLIKPVSFAEFLGVVEEIARAGTSHAQERRAFNPGGAERRRGPREMVSSTGQPNRDGGGARRPVDEALDADVGHMLDCTSSSLSFVCEDLWPTSRSWKNPRLQGTSLASSRISNP
ncbi:MAG TPA: response regulator [Planctomycetota bacterium]|nr:response regulator [Planctomycetota bacterium]